MIIRTTLNELNAFGIINADKREITFKRSSYSYLVKKVGYTKLIPQGTRSVKSEDYIFLQLFHQIAKEICKIPSNNQLRRNANQ